MASLSHSPASSHRVIPDGPKTMARADLRKPEPADFRAVIGRCIDAARQTLGWNLEQFAGAVKRDPRQARRWLDGSERAQFDALWAVEELQGPLVIALAGLVDGIEITTEIRIRRPA